MTKLILPEPTRQDKLKGWLCAHRLTYVDLASHLGLTDGAVSYILNRDHARPERVEQFKALGIPAELLPEPKYIAPGPKPKSAPLTPEEKNHA